MKTSVVAVCGLCVSLAVPVQAAAKEITLKNRHVVAAYDADSAVFRLTTADTGLSFLRDGRFTAGAGPASVVKLKHPVFGFGQAIEVRHPDGRRDQIQVFPQLPFAFFRTSLTNGAAETSVTRQYEPFAATVQVLPPGPVSEVKTLGTGGLLAPDKNPGSYVWLAYVDAPSRKGVVAGWLTQARASGVLFSADAKNPDQTRLLPRLDFGRLRLAPGAAEDLDTLAVGYFADARLGLEHWADTVARERGIVLPPQPAGYCTWYSNPHGGASDEVHLKELTAYSAKELAPYGFSVVQIDDGWQAGISTNGPKRNFFTHAEKGPYPSGMKAIADAIRGHGLTAGIWFMPFAGTYYDPFFKEHPDWFVKRQDGAPYETDWGGTCMDLTHPEVHEYLRANVRRMSQEWGFKYFKMDGLWTGTASKQIYVNEGYREDGLGDAVHRNPDKTNLEVYRDGLKLIREAVGREVFILGCCIPQNMRSYGTAMGWVDAMRIGPDNGSGWGDLLRGPTFGSRQYFLHGRVWYNDPDPVYLRTNVPLQQARALCSWVALSGQLNLDSDWIPGLPKERLDLFRQTLPGHGLRPRPVDLFDRPIPRVWLLTDTRSGVRRDVVGLFNWSDKEEVMEESFERVGLDPAGEYQAFSYWDNRLVANLRERVRMAVPARSCVVLALRRATTHPCVLSTSRHVTQGVVDIARESWRPWKRQLQGRSQVVGGDPYELRIALQTPDRLWKVAKVLTQASDASAVAEVETIAEGDLARVILRTPKTQEIGWSVSFE